MFGKELAVRETRRNFESAKTIHIDILYTYESANAVAGELRIVVDDSDVLYVTDVVSFDNKGQINAIRAYIGRED